ncbi:hypothetical protein G7070_05370 [Propioniciclava coleopterorum]|uniref:Uncharacterized protein n=1 Tax=Propioniciclava coleopterorum TaxID=2714937 RepID=A0A6G7Y521_9ACTN|nr:DUF5713 family protein [Propioniciclava coleopterorum]QIK71809.1 hypothetical protein G7070_05370 [Propioniciclava coleopterorum]
MPITDPTMASYPFLAGMYASDYFPDHLVDKGAAILRGLCERIETQRPADLPALYALTHAATEQFNDLQEEFWDAGSEIETAARDCIGLDFERIAQAYGHADADIEELTAPRDW